MAKDKTGKNLEEQGQALDRPSRLRGLSPLEEMERMVERMDRMMEGFLPRRWMPSFDWELPSFGRMSPFEGRFPKVDVIDKDEEIVVRAEIPGVEKDDLDVSLSENMLTIKGTTKHEEKEEHGDYFRREMSRGTFSRTVALPAEVDDGKAKASFKDGVLELNLPKAETSKRRNIKVD